jgi:hypothetical protein
VNLNLNDFVVVGTGRRCVIWNYDIFGLNGGRTKEISDLIAEVLDQCCQIAVYLIRFNPFHLQ